MVEQLLAVQWQLRQKRKENRLEKNLKAQSYKSSHKRLLQKRTAEYEVKSLKDEAEEMIEEMVSKYCEIDQLRGGLRQSMTKKLRRVHTKGRGGSCWYLWVVKLCIELLVAGVTPSEIPNTIQTTYETFYGKFPEGRVSIDFVGSCLPVAEALGCCMVAMLLAGVLGFKKINATTRHKNPFSDMVMGFLVWMQEKM